MSESLRFPRLVVHIRLILQHCGLDSWLSMTVSYAGEELSHRHRFTSGKVIISTTDFHAISQVSSSRASSIP